MRVVSGELLYNKGRILLFLLFVCSVPLTAQQGWWKTTTVYQVYPRSFYDSNGDGIGDLQGIIQKLDYIQELGFETIWISPFFSSPQKDFGYDISNYYSIAPEYGDTAVCKQLIQEVHKRKMRIVFDLVMNHTSDEHPWFKESAASTNNAKSDWYVWKNGKGRNGTKPPNNWKSMVGGSGWHYNKQRNQFYWASFLNFQPDLNYHNPEVKKAMLDVAKYWMNKGADGFRLDIFNAIYEDTAFTDNPFRFKLIPDEKDPDGFFQKAKYTINNPGSFEFATELRAVADKTGAHYLVGEVFGKPSVLKQYCYYKDKPGLNTVFLFRTLNTPLKAKAYRELVADFEANFPTPYLPTYVYSNHDRKRSMSRLRNNTAKAKLQALFQFTVRGIPFTYYGEELGMPQTNIPLKKGKDPMAQRLKWMPQVLVNLSAEAINRDGCRTPMLWNKQRNAGFTAGAEPWLPVTENYSVLCVEQQQQDKGSLLQFYKALLKLRNTVPALQAGSLEIAEAYCTKRIFAYYRTFGNERYLVVLNMSKRNVMPVLPAGNTILTLNVLTGGKLGAYGALILKVR
jgi:oligo-1,6-glucosidase/alpha-glucosidase